MLWTRCKMNYSPPCASFAGTIHYFLSLAAAAWHINSRAVTLSPVQIGQEGRRDRGGLEATSEERESI